MATDGNRATTARALKVPRLPGDIMIYPMIAGLLINTFCPQVLEIGGFFTAATRGGASAVVAAILLFVGAGISFKATPGASRRASSCSSPSFCSPRRWASPSLGSSTTTSSACRPSLSSAASRFATSQLEGSGL